MMGKTHLAVGIASSLVLTQPRSSSEFAIAVIGGALGGVASDIDVKLDFKNKYANRYAWDAIGSEIVAIMIAIGLLVSDFILKGGICESILQHQYLSIAGLVICVLFVVLGERNKKHRGRTHSLLALLLSSAGIFLIHPYIGISYAIGFASHIACDLLNKSKVQVLYPLDKTGICFNFCYAERLINQILCGVGLTIIFIYVYIMKFV